MIRIAMLAALAHAVAAPVGGPVIALKNLVDSVFVHLEFDAGLDRLTARPQPWAR
jgi:hypothetical protein